MCGHTEVRRHRISKAWSLRLIESVFCREVADRLTEAAKLTEAVIDAEADLIATFPPN